MKKFLQIILPVLVVALLAGGLLVGCKKEKKKEVLNSDRENEKIYNFEVDGNGYEIVSVKTGELDEHLVIPSTYKGKPVVSIGDECFRDHVELKSVKIPNSVKRIGENAFVRCYSLVEVWNLSSLDIVAGSWNHGSVAEYALAVHTDASAQSVVSKDANGFLSYADAEKGLYVLVGYEGTKTNITLPDSISGQNYVIRDCAFYQNETIQSVIIPDRVTSIGDGVFSGCSGLASVTIGNGVIGIGERAFYWCTDLASVAIGNGVTSIGEDAFHGCSGIETINLNYATIGREFRYKSSITTIVLGNDVETIVSDAFSGCDNLFEVWNLSSLNIVAGSWNHGRVALYALAVYTDASVPSKVSKDANGFVTYADAGKGDYILVCYQGTEKNITLPDSIAGQNYVIRKGAFSGNKSLTSVVIPNSVTTIGASAFFVCTGLEEIVIPNSVTSIGNWAFHGCTSLATVTIGNGVESIGSYAFEDCISLTSVTIGNSVESIGEMAFYGCTSLTSVTIGNSVTSIGNLAFSGCRSLVEIWNLSSLDIVAGSWKNGQVAGCAVAVYTDASIPSKVSKDANGFLTYTDAEKGLYVLVGYEGTETNITLPDNIDGHNYVIRDLAFYENETIQSVTIPNSVTSIGSSAFYRCTGLTSVTIGNSVTSIGESAFRDCTSLATVAIGSGVESIGSGAFNGCTGLTEIVIPNSVTSIGDSAFSYCTSLTSVTIGIGVTSIGYWTFSGCTGLTEIVIPNNVTSIGEDAFYECTGLASVIIPNSVESIGESAFFGCSGLATVTIGNSVTSIGEDAFHGCSGLTEIVFSDGIDWDNLVYAEFLPNKTLTLVVNGTNQTTIETALSKLVTLDYKSQYTIQIDSSLVGSISNTYRFKEIKAIPAQ